MTVWDLLHALLLPSGNDAAVCLAHFFGTKIASLSKENGRFNLSVQRQYLHKAPSIIFIEEMNKFTMQRNLKNTQYVNPHGLSNKGNRSTSEELGKLGSILMHDPNLRHIVSQKDYRCSIRNSNGNRIAYWQNTNKLLKHGFNGIKTGQTCTAGPCMCSSFVQGDIFIIITILHCKN